MIDLTKYPMFMNIPQCTKITGIPQFKIRDLAKEGKIVSFNSGRVFKVNLESLVNYLCGNKEELNG